MRAALLLPLLVLACMAVAEGASRKTLSTTGRPHSPHPTPANHTATNHTATNHTMPIKAGKGVPVKVGKIGHGRPRATKPAALKHPFSIQSTQATIGEEESCYSIGLREFCDSKTQANCCEHLDSDDNWVGCEVASNLYTCTYQFEDKPITVCCS